MVFHWAASTEIGGMGLAWHAGCLRGRSGAAATNHCLQRAKLFSSQLSSLLLDRQCSGVKS